MDTTTTMHPLSFPFPTRRPLHHCHPFSLPQSPTLLPSHPKPISLSFSPPPPIFFSPPPPIQLPLPTPPHQPNSSPEHHLRVRRLLRFAAAHRDLALARALHAVITKTHHHQSSNDPHATRLFNSLMCAYLKLGRLPDGRKVFDEMPCPDVASYTALISAFAKSHHEHDAVQLFLEMRTLAVEPNEFTFVAILTDCIRRFNSFLGSQIHALAIKMLYCSCLHVANALMGLYVKCERVDDALRLFDGMLERDVSSWNAVILGMVKEGRYGEAFELFNDMKIDGISGDRFSLSTLLTAAAEGFGQTCGEAIHAYALKIGLELDLSMGNALIGFYTKFGCVEDVVDVFQRMPVRDVISCTGMLTGYMEFGQVESAVEVFYGMPERNYISYNALLAGFCQNGEGSRGIELFREILEGAVEISDFTLTSVVNACAMVSDRSKSEQIHAFVTKAGCGSNAWIEAALLDMCARCGRMDDAWKIFHRWSYDKDRSVAWTAIICGHARNGQPDEAISLFHMMSKAEGIEIMDEVALSMILGVCGTLGFAELGKQIHCSVLKSGVLAELGVSNGLFSMYAKSGNMEDAVRFFKLMPRRDRVSWNALITSYLLYRQGDEALAVWGDMEKLGVKPDSITLLLILSACRYTNLKSTDTCRKLFFSMTSLYSIEPTSEHYAAMIDVFGYWSCFDEAEELIKNMPCKPDASVWRALLDCCRLRSNLSLGRQAVQHLLALKPQDPSTYILVSNLYSASGRWHCSEKVREEMWQKGLQKHPARSWIIHQNKVHSFYARDRSHPQYKDIHSGLEILILECMKAGYEPDTSFVLHEVEEYQKRDFLYYHSAKLAATYGLLMAGVGEPVRVVKNIHLCGDCHMFLKFVSSVTGREILLRDTSGFHSFKGGECSCGDSW